MVLVSQEDTANPSGQGVMPMNSNLLKYYIKKNGDTQKTLAEYLKISLSCLNAKINNKDTCFSLEEIQKIINRYSLTADDLISIFFAKPVSQ